MAAKRLPHQQHQPGNAANASPEAVAILSRLSKVTLIDMCAELIALESDRPGNAAGISTRIESILRARRARGAWNNPQMPLEQRFEEKVDRTGGRLACHLWTGARGPQGQYGRLWVSEERRHMMAHRVAYLIAHGEIPPGMCVCHHCDNTLCVNPEHLFIGTHGDNAKDRDRKGRHRGGRVCGQDHPDAKLTEDQARMALELKGRVPGTDIARRLGVSSRTIYDIHKGKTWKHLTR